MKEPTFNGRKLLPLSVMEAAHAGDAMAMEQVLRYYAGYINKLHPHLVRQQRHPLCVRGRVYEAPFGTQAHPFHHRCFEVTARPR